MKNIFFAAAIMVCAAACQRAILPVATPVVHNEITNENGQQILLGHAAVSAIQANTYKTWFDQSRNSYPVDTVSVHQLTPLLENKHVDIFLGTWCGDSRREVPRMLKILEQAGFDTANLSLVFVDNATHAYKQSPQHEERGKNIHHVPSFIVYDRKKEMGRIIESPVVSLEKDLLSILSASDYQPKYTGIAFWTDRVTGQKKPMTDAVLQTIAGQLQLLVAHYGEFNAYGRMLMASGKRTEAMNVFKLNSILYPQQPAAWMALAEASETCHDSVTALKAYEKLLVFNPGDETIAKKIRLLKQ